MVYLFETMRNIQREEELVKEIAELLERGISPEEWPEQAKIVLLYALKGTGKENLAEKRKISVLKRHLSGTCLQRTEQFVEYLERSVNQKATKEIRMAAELLRSALPHIVRYRVLERLRI